MLNRRHFIGSVAGAAMFAAAPRIRAQQLNTDRKFIFIYAEGGWDPLAVFAPLFDSQYIDMEPGSQRMSVGQFRLVDHQNRPQVRTFFNRWHAQTTVINGISTRSVGHEACTVVSLTGDAGAVRPDWPTLMAGGGETRYSLPSLVLGGPSFPGDLESLVGRTGDSGQLDALVRGEVEADADFSRLELDGHRVRLDAFLKRRFARHLNTDSPAELMAIKESLSSSLDRATQLKGLDTDLPFLAEGLDGQLDSAISVLRHGLSRCVTVTDGGDWDSHEDNADQAPLFNSLFASLDRLMNQLSSTRGESGRPLIDETTVIVMSEMGRTPMYNDTGGRDHWPYTSAMFLGAGIQGGQQFGGYDPSFSGIGFDGQTGRLMPDQLGVSSMDFGATLLALAGLDPGRYLPQSRSLNIVLAS